MVWVVLWPSFLTAAATKMNVHDLVRITIGWKISDRPLAVSDISRRRQLVG
jgi:hypothetical protein